MSNFMTIFTYHDTDLNVKHICVILSHTLYFLNLLVVTLCSKPLILDNLIFHQESVKFLNTFYFLFYLTSPSSAKVRQTDVVLSDI